MRRLSITWFRSAAASAGGAATSAISVAAETVYVSFFRIVVSSVSGAGRSCRLTSLRRAKGHVRGRLLRLAHRLPEHQMKVVFAAVLAQARCRDAAAAAVRPAAGGP